MQTIIKSRYAGLMIAFGGLILLILYAYHKNLIAISADEFAKIHTARLGLGDSAVWFNPRGVWMPLHLILIGVTSLFANDWLIAVRIVSIAFGLVLVLAIWDIGRQLGGDRCGAIAAILGATHPLACLLSATAMADICYVSMFMMGLSFYLRFSARRASALEILLWAAASLRWRARSITTPGSRYFSWSPSFFGICTIALCPAASWWSVSLFLAQHRYSGLH